MRYLIFILSLAFFYNAKSQDISKQLQKQMWYVKGDIYKGDTCSIQIDKPQNCSGYLIFNKDELEMHMEGTDNRFVCIYEILNNKIKLHIKIKFTSTKKSEDVKIFYKLLELSNGKNFELTPIAAADFK